ncbi:MAG TPA: type II toxin-antitoxin system VapC family toxin [Rhizomicrobium sp.]
MHAIDTNVLVRLLVRDDSRQVKLAEAFVSRGAWVSQLVLAETAWVLESVYNRTPRQIAATVEGLLNHRDLVVQDPEIVSKALERLRGRPATEFTDCLILENARKSGHLPLGTFDRRFARLEGTTQL